MYGVDVVNNLVIDNDDWDLGASTGAIVGRSDYNYMSDEEEPSGHEQWLQQDSHSRFQVFGTTYGFAHRTHTIDTVFSGNLTNLEKLMQIYDEVVYKLGLNGNGAPYDPEDEALAIPGITASGDNIGAL